MTYAEREQIFAKEYLTIADLQDLLGLTYSAAATLIRTIKRSYDRLHIQGKIHVQDYIDFFELNNSLRYAERAVQE